MKQKQQFLTIREAAIYLGLSPRTLYNWRVQGRGPAFFLLDKKARISRYSVDDLDAWARKHSATSTSWKGVA